MKSAYELAMEKLQKTVPSRPITPEQREALAEVDSRYRARIAEQEIRYGDDIQAASASGDHFRVDRLREELSGVIARLEAERDEKKEAIRQSE
jgi:hypothetical protein